MVVVILVELGVELGKLVFHWELRILGAYQIQHGHLHHTLVEVRSPVLHHLDGHNLLCLQVLAFDHLTKCTLTEHIQDKVPVSGLYQQPVIPQESLENSLCLLRAQYIVDIQDVVTVLIVVTIVLDTLAGLCQDSSGVPRRLVLELGIANPVRCGEVAC